MSLSHTPYLIRHPQSSQFWFRRRVPQHLRPALGRTEIRVSLQTPIPHDAVQRCRLTANIVDKLFAEAETRNERIGDELAAQLQTLRSEFGDPDSITAPLERWMIPTLLTRYQEALLAGHELQCQAMPPNELSPVDAADPEKRAAHQKAEDEAYAAIGAESTELQEQLKQLERARTFKRLSVIDDSAAAHLYAERLSPLTTTADVLEDYKFELLRKEIEVVRLLIERLNGGVEPFVLKQTIARWLYMSLLTGRYTSSPESRYETDLRMLPESSDPAVFVKTLRDVEAATLTDDYWSKTLPLELSTSASRGRTEGRPCFVPLANA